MVGNSLNYAAGGHNHAHTQALTLWALQLGENYYKWRHISPFPYSGSQGVQDFPVQATSSPASTAAIQG